MKALAFAFLLLNGLVIFEGRADVGLASTQKMQTILESIYSAPEGTACAAELSQNLSSGRNGARIVPANSSCFAYASVIRLKLVDFRNLVDHHCDELSGNSCRMIGSTLDVLPKIKILSKSIFNHYALQNPSLLTSYEIVASSIYAKDGIEYAIYMLRETVDELTTLIKRKK